MKYNLFLKRSPSFLIYTLKKCMPYKKISGIYKIKNIINNKVYIGSSVSVLKRMQTHKSLLLESINKIKISQYKRVYKISMNGDILDEYSSIIDASEKNNIHKQSISSCCRNKLNSSGGFYWCFVKDYNNNKNYKKIKRGPIKHTKYIYENKITGEKYFKLKDVFLATNINNLNLMFSGKIKNKTNFIRYEFIS